MAESDYSILKTDEGFCLSGPILDRLGHESWQATELGEDRILLETVDSKKAMVTKKDGNGWSPIDIFADFVFGMHHRSWSGIIAVDTGTGVKKIFFSDGEIVFAAANVIDDRLGEIIYRQGMLTLDQLTDCSVQVGRTRKFGQVLLQSGIFNNVQLWDALKAQVREIVRSIFTAEQVYFEMSKGRSTAPTEIVFTEGTNEFLEVSYGYGCMFRDFVSRIGPECMVEVPEFDKVRTVYREGTFIGDFIGMVKESKSVSDLLEVSKLTHANTFAALMSLVHLGVCSISPTEEGGGFRDRAHLAKLRSKLDVYSIMLAEVHKAFGVANQAFPATDLRKLIRSVDSDQVPSILLNKNGEITRGSVERIFSQCQSTHGRGSYYAIRLDCLIQFLLQVAGDNLPWEIKKDIRENYRKLIQ